MCTPPACDNLIGMIEIDGTDQACRNGLSRVLTAMGATVHAKAGHGLSVTGMDVCTIA
jgi:hypothetical protein